jgi:inhibitor of the pro-sigma K processing machinery
VAALDTQTIVAFTFALVILYLVLRTVYAPLRFLLRIAWRGALGVLILWGVNLVGSLVAFSLPINLFTALTIGYLGLPGFLLILTLRHLTA